MAGRSFLMVMVGLRWLGGGGVRVQVGLGGVEGESRETETENSGYVMVCPRTKNACK